MTPTASRSTQVAVELDEFRAELKSNHVDCSLLMRRQLTPVLFDLAVDWTLIVLAAVLCDRLGPLYLPIALLLVGSRQRALGNLLHEGAHRNLARGASINDWLTTLALALPLGSSLARYRSRHFQHHAALGHAAGDPDFIPETRRSGSRGRWTSALAMRVLSREIWVGNVVSDLRHGAQVARSAAWWSCFALLIGLTLGTHVLAWLAAVWLLARATTFHLITEFRELCDHFGLRPGGIWSYTRNTRGNAFLARMIHPHANGYHLVHHLMPSVPYHQLARAHGCFGKTAMYRRLNASSSGYFLGRRAVVTEWAD